MSWTTSEATAFVAEIHDDMSAIGCDVGVYGSVARGALGNDLDLVVWAPDGGTVDISGLVDVFARYGAYPEHSYGGGPETYLVLTRSGQRIHVRILSSVTAGAPVRPAWLNGPLRPTIDK